VLTRNYPVSIEDPHVRVQRPARRGDRPGRLPHQPVASAASAP
jgi:hypothetical protein